jgi:hypothetical protein
MEDLTRELLDLLKEERGRTDRLIELLAGILHGDISAPTKSYGETLRGIPPEYKPVSGVRNWNSIRPRLEKMTKRNWSEAADEAAKALADEMELNKAEEEQNAS